MPRFGVGQPVRRLEDKRFLTGAGQFVDDINVHNRKLYFPRVSTIALAVDRNLAHPRATIT